MTESTSNGNRMEDGDLRLTPAARDKMAALLREVDGEEYQALRIYAAGGGCSGMSFGMAFTDSHAEGDRVLEGEGFAIHVDAAAMEHLRGAEIDFVERPEGASFVFNNIQTTAGRSGGCGGCGSGGGCA